MGDDDEQFRAYAERISNAKIGITSRFSDEEYQKILDASYVDGRIRIEERGAWPEFFFRGSEAVLNIGGENGRWVVEEVSIAGVTLRRVS